MLLLLSDSVWNKQLPERACREALARADLEAQLTADNNSQMWR